MTNTNTKASILLLFYLSLHCYCRTYPISTVPIHLGPISFALPCLRYRPLRLHRTATRTDKPRADTPTSRIQLGRASLPRPPNPSLVSYCYHDLLTRPCADMHATRTKKLRADLPMDPEPIASTILPPHKPISSVPIRLRNLNLSLAPYCYPNLIRSRTDMLTEPALAPYCHIINDYKYRTDLTRPQTPYYT